MRDRSLPRPEGFDTGAAATSAAEPWSSPATGTAPSGPGTSDRAILIAVNVVAGSFAPRFDADHQSTDVASEEEVNLRDARGKLVRRLDIYAVPSPPPSIERRPTGDQANLVLHECSSFRHARPRNPGKAIVPGQPDHCGRPA